jgi:hypothetical protein
MNDAQRPFGFTVKAVRSRYGPEKQTNQWGVITYVEQAVDQPYWRVYLPH